MDANLINLSLSGDAKRTVTSLLACGRYPEREPDKLVIDDSPRPSDAKWAEVFLSREDVWAKWFRNGDAYADDNFWLMRKGELVHAHFDLELDAETVIDTIAGLPFELGALFSVHEEWYDDWGYDDTGFGDGHTGHGAMCGFRGLGHERLVSRRWLDYGPWRVIRRPNDLTLVQFHDLEVDAKTALEQAEPGHQRMGISRTGGFIQKRFVYAHDLKGLYEPDKKRHKIIVHGREVTQSEMLDAAALRHYRKDDPEKPLDSIAYVFAVPEEAHAHLHEMWLREIEVWTFDPATGKEIRLDDTYEPPPPNPPDWVTRLDEAT